MSDTITGFGRAAGKLARNPLGIIALFVVLVYGCAMLVVGASERLDAGDRRILIWFVVVFPNIVLGAFFTLVTQHPNLLYSPEDFRNDEAYLLAIGVQRLNESEKMERIVGEAAASEAEAKLQVVEGQADAPETADTRSGEELPTPPSDANAVQTTVGVHSKAGQPTVRRVLAAETMGVWYIERTMGLRLTREAALGDNRRLVFDGVGRRMDGTVVVVEVKFLVRAFVSLETLQSIRSSLVEAKALLESRKHVGGFLAVIVFVVGDRTGSLHRVMTKASDVFARSLQPTEFSVVVEDLSRLEALAVGDSSGESEPK